MAEAFDAVVVGAGPAGSAAALSLARAGCSVALLERGPFPGSKNMYGGVVYGRILDELLPRWWEEAPIQRWVVRRATMVLTDTQSLTVDFRTDAWGEPPYNGATAYRPDFDAWLASKAVDAGATLICDTVVTGLLGSPKDGAVHGGRGGRRGRGRHDVRGMRGVRGVRTDRPDGDVSARVVVACDGVNSFLAREAGLAVQPDAHHFTLGAKETLALPAEVIEDRFGLGPGEGADFEIIGGTQGIAGGGFLYTNRDTVSVGVVLHLPELAESKCRPEEVIAGLKAHRAIAPLVAGGDLVEYSAHLIPEGGYDVMPRLVGDGILVAGDAAAMCLAAGIWLEGVNFAVASGAAAGSAAAEALAAGDTSARGLGGYRRRIDANFVMADHKKLRRAPSLILSDRVQHRYPQLMCNLVESMFTVTNPEPKAGMLALTRREARRAGVRLGQLARDTVSALRSYG